MLRIENISFQYRSSFSHQEIFQSLNHSFPGLGIIHLKGINGAGKTTLLRILAGLCLPKTGTIFWNQQILHQNDVTYLSSTQSSSFTQLTGLETLKSFALLNENNSFEKEKWWELLQKHPAFIKALKQKYGHCSTGMKQLINVAIALTKPALLILLDEPYRGLDQDATEILNSLLMEMKKEKLFILTSHQDLHLNEIDQILILKEGKISHA